MKFQDGTWADIAVWGDRDAAEQACVLHPPPEVEDFFRRIAEDVSHEPGHVVREL